MSEPPPPALPLLHCSGTHWQPLWQWCKVGLQPKVGLAGTLCSDSFSFCACWCSILHTLMMANCLGDASQVLRFWRAKVATDKCHFCISPALEQHLFCTGGSVLRVRSQH